VAAQHEGPFLMFFENDPAEVICDGLVRVLGLKDDEEWRKAADATFDVRQKRYQYAPSLLLAFDQSIERHFDGLPEVAERVVTLVKSRSQAEE
jgi:hypothetical protein